MIEEPQELYTGLTSSTLLQVDVLRATCQHSSQMVDEESTFHWVFAFPSFKESFPYQDSDRDERDTDIHTLVADFHLFDEGWVIAVTVRGQFFSSETPDFSAPGVKEEFVAKHALWANQTLWDYARATMRSLLAHIPSADEVLTLPLRAPEPEIINPHSNTES